MLFSMTGFSSKTLLVPSDTSESSDSSERVSVSVEIKSLNSRFFESSCKLPGSLSFLELPIINNLKKRLIRGRVFVFVRVGGGSDIFERVLPVKKIVKDYISSSSDIKKEFNLSGELKISDIIFLPNVFSFEKEKVGEEFEKFILNIIDDVTDELVKVRKNEGSRLSKDLKKRFDLCSSYIDQVEKKYKSFMEKKKSEAAQKLSLVKEGDQEAESSLSDCYDLINKIDIHEEIIRFKSHLDLVKKIFVSDQVENGKRLEFVLQELSRETNTIAAKCSYFDVSSLAIDIKVELEKVREQVQNIV